ncbi:MAG: AbrB/MazE/SpoVT family DNA-binding domain-containing protein [Candidatus Pacebacteria bacterium]|nr:AbrB/MazE/SpoVT family DNA-binding domain-containing protein [Candidatus Paceibacterota bacterium]
MAKQMGICQKRKKFFGVITVTEKGQIAIPVGLRSELEIKKGDKLIVIKRNDNKGINLLKVGIMDNFLEKISKD